MTHRRTHQFAALALSVVMTLAIFNGTLSLSSPVHAGNWYAWSAAVDTARG